MNGESKIVNRESGSEHHQRISTFEDLEVYQAARKFRRAMYRIAKQLPETEKFGLANQIRRTTSRRDTVVITTSIKSNLRFTLVALSKS